MTQCALCPLSCRASLLAVTRPQNLSILGHYFSSASGWRDTNYLRAFMLPGLGCTGGPGTVHSSPVRLLRVVCGEHGSCCRHPAPHQTSDTFHFLRNKVCLWDVIHTAASAAGAWGVGEGLGSKFWSLLLPSFPSQALNSELTPQPPPSRSLLSEDWDLGWRGTTRAWEGDLLTAADESEEHTGTHQPTPPLDSRNWQSPEPGLAQVEGKALLFLSHPQQEILAKCCSDSRHQRMPQA